MQVGNFQSFVPQYGGGIAPSHGPSPFQGPGGPSPFGGGGMQTMNMLFSLMSSLAQLSQGWGGFGGGGFGGGGNPYGGGGPFGGGGGGGPFGGGYGQPHDYASQHFPHLQNYNPNTGGGYGGGGGGGTRPLPGPSDPQEFASYLQAQVAGGALQGKTGIAQNDAIPGSRFGTVQDSTMWQASLARNYAYQFAAQATGANPLTPQGLAQGQQNFSQMKPEAQLFMQVASVFKGDLLGGPGFYDNPGLKNLLQSRGLGNFINDPQVGKTDVQTIGAITAAINSGQLSLNDVINSGTIDDLNRYNNVINYVTQGGFAQDLNNYDTVRI
jgi:hypothetical protein